jgi:cell wall assembly regulator SMI1
VKHRLTTLIAEIHTHLLELSQFPGWDFIRPLPHPPASPEQIADYERRLGMELPPSYRAFLGLHNGYDWLAYPGHMLAIDDVQPGGEWFEPLQRWKQSAAKWGASEVLDGVVIANLGQPNNWVYLDPLRPQAEPGELTLVEWEPEDSHVHADLIGFLEECLETVKYGIAEASGSAQA